MWDHRRRAKCSERRATPSREGGLHNRSKPFAISRKGVFLPKASFAGSTAGGAQLAGLEQPYYSARELDAIAWISQHPRLPVHYDLPSRVHGSSDASQPGPHCFQVHEPDPSPRLGSANSVTRFRTAPSVASLTNPVNITLSPTPSSPALPRSRSTSSPRPAITSWAAGTSCRTVGQHSSSSS